jgi:methylenetetrahydrofolate reductase (NADPH)
LQIENRWEEFVGDFSYHPANGFYVFGSGDDSRTASVNYGQKPVKPHLSDRLHFHLLELAHRFFFNSDASLAPVYRALSRWIDASVFARTLLHLFENVGKQILLRCRQCGDCAIQYVAFQCPESGCPKHIRNGACGGSRNGRCEVYPDRWCIWYRAYQRWASVHRTDEMIRGCVPPRKWELDHSSSWLNFHLGRDHQNGSADFARYCCARSACSHAGDGLCSGQKQGELFT